MLPEGDRLELIRGVVSRHWVPLVGAAVVVLLGLAWLMVGDDEDQSIDDRGDLEGALALAAQILGPVTPDAAEYAIAHPTGSRVDLHSSPDGGVIERLGPRTEFGSPRTLLVARSRGDWIGVVTPELPNGRLGWLKGDSGQIDLSHTSLSIHVDLSARALELRDGNDVIHRARVSIGRAGHRTPSGLFSVTDALAGRGLGPWYGCCALATSGHQPNLPPGWVGGDRIAIHGTPGAVGGAVSTGCLRTTNADMVALFSKLPLGAPVFVRA
jgi:L,D-transpeptidase catalytic domain